MNKALAAILTTRRTADAYPNAVLFLSCLLPFLVPFSLEKNIDTQASLLIITGLLSWVCLALGHKHPSWHIPLPLTILLASYIAFCLVSLVVHPSIADLYGSSLIRLGSLALVACIGCGLLLTVIDTRRLLLWLYVTCVSLAVITLPYTWLTAHYFARLGSVFHQADILSVWMACGLILGFGVWRQYPARHWLILATQGCVAIILLFSQTRAVLVILMLVCVLIITQTTTKLWRRIILCLVSIGLLLVGITASQVVLPHRLTNAESAVASMTYRLTLQSYGLRASVHQPVWGYGAGDLPVALACTTLHDRALQATCHDGFYFDSSHNIFLDRILAVGFVGGLAFIGFVIVSLYRGLRRAGSERYFSYCALLICAYYCTNVTSVTLELLLWVTLLRTYRSNA